MKPHCTFVVKYVLPALRAKVAKELMARGYKMREVARMLGLTQAAVSQYMSSKRGQKGLEIIESTEEVKKIVLELVDLIVQEKATIEDESDYLCRICEVLRAEKTKC